MATAIAAGLAVVPAAGAFAAKLVPSATLSSKAPAASALLEKAAADRVVRVIVTLRTDGAAVAAQDVSKSADARRKAATGAAIDGFLDRLMGPRAAASASATRYSARRMTNVPLVSLTVTTADLEKIAKDASVVRIVENVPVPPTLTQSVPLIGMPGVWPNNGEGLDTIIAILDTGVQSSHPFVNGRVLGQACFSTSYTDSGDNSSESFCPGGASSATGNPSGQNCPYPEYDECGHGTHVAGIAAGFQEAGPPPEGVARSASLFAVQVFSHFPDRTDAEVLSWVDDQIAALDYLYAQRASMPGGLRLAAINMSLGAGENTESCTDDPRRPVIQLLRAAGIATVVSTGNDGFTGATGAPACIPEVISVGSSTKSDAISDFSNINSLTTLLAPGSDILSSIPGDEFAESSGTSMAAPHVSGAIASLMSAVPDATLDEIVTSLASTGKLIADDRAGGTVTKPRICVADALADLGVASGDLGISTSSLHFTNSEGTVTPASADITLTSPSNTIAWTLTGLPDWLSASASSGTVSANAPEKVTLTVNAPSDQASDLSATLAFKKVSCAAEAKTVSATLEYDGGVVIPQRLYLSSSSSKIKVKKGKAKPSSFTVKVRSEGAYPAWRITSYPSWLSPSTKSGSGPKTVSFKVKVSKKAKPGVYRDYVKFAQTGPGGRTAYVSLTLTVVKTSKDEIGLVQE